MKPVRISVNALGGQGGGVLADWIVSLGEAEGWVAQATSVPGVAQRTGATVYYLELCPPDPAGRAPVQALMPVPGDVDIVIASELMEAGRAIARGLVTPDRTTLIASSHRIFAIAEKSAMGDGITSPARVLEACRTSARRLVLADLNALAEREGSVISAALFGALAGSGALPFPRDAFKAAIRRGGVGVESSLRAFSAAFDLAQTPAAPTEEEAPRPHKMLVTIKALRRAVAERLPDAVRAIATMGVERLVDYQDAAYAGTYIDRLEAIAGAERQLTGGRDEWPLTREAARHLALWMAYEDVIRVADLKTRSARLTRVLEDVRARPEHVVRVTEFMHPRFEEFCDMMPNWLGRRLMQSDRARSRIASLIERDRTITTSSPAGFMMLYLLARLRRFRRGTYRFAVEMERIDGWLTSALNAARSNPALALEVIRCQRLVKGYGDTHSRGLHNFAIIMRLLPTLATRGEGAEAVRRLREAALKDDEGRVFAKAVSDLNAQAPLYNAA